jgi:predicted naringenin-chalcone synthase
LAYILDIETALPAHKHSQDSILAYMQQAYNLDTNDARKLSFLYHKSGIKTRHSVLDDFSKPFDSQSFSVKNTTIQQRMAVYESEALPLALAAIKPLLIRQKLTPTHLITVSCTGMQAPGLDIQLCESLALPNTIQRTSVNFMGCYAAIHALKIADYIAKSDADAVVLIVAVELCTLHFQKEFNDDTALSDLLFADGAAATLVVGENTPIYHKKRSLKGFYSELRLAAQSDMTWKIADTGFKMTLSGYVPQLVETDFRAFVVAALASQNLTMADVSDWCIHPGGKKIIEATQKSLKLTDHDLRFSYKVLSDYGNMSSPTVLFVLKQILDGASDGGCIFGAAFGPGLTLESFIVSGHEL